MRFCHRSHLCWSRCWAAIDCFVVCLLVILPLSSVYAADAPPVEKAGSNSPAGAVSSIKSDAVLTVRNLFLLKLLIKLNLNADQIRAISPLVTRLKTADDQLILASAQIARPAQNDLRDYAGEIYAQRPPNPAVEARVNGLLTATRAKEVDLIAMQREIAAAIRDRLSAGQLALLRAGAARCPAGKGLDEVEDALQLPLYDPDSSIAVASRAVTAAPTAAAPPARAPALSSAMANVVADALTDGKFRQWRDPAQDHSEKGMVGQLQHFALTLDIDPFGPQFPALKDKVMSQMQQMQGIGPAQYLAVQGDLGSHVLRNYRNLGQSSPGMAEDAACIRQVFLDPYIIVCLQRLSQPVPDRSGLAAQKSASSTGAAATDPAADALHLLLEDRLLAQLSSLRLSKTQCGQIIRILTGVVDAERVYGTAVDPELRTAHADFDSVNTWWNGGAPYPADAVTRADAVMNQIEPAKDRFQEQRAAAIKMIIANLSVAQRRNISNGAASLASMVDAAVGEGSDSGSQGDAPSSPWKNGMDGGEASALAGGAAVLDMMQECREAASEKSGYRFRLMVDTVTAGFSEETGLAPTNPETEGFQRDVADWLHAVSVMDDHSYSQLRDSVAAKMRRDLHLPTPDATVDPDAIRLLFLNEVARRYVQALSTGR